MDARSDRITISELLGSLVSPCWATHFFQSRLPGREKSRQKRWPLHPDWASPVRCARLPSFHRRSGGRRTRAIHGPLSRGRLVLSRHPCRSLPYATIALGLLKGANGVA
ncbi:hypothetical protein EA798_00380 [Pseudomonas songnenensis]|uniref:DUF1534 domain-containing protein n=1 Tax=Pseudomonas songnenensis TaxID=1176259 RepID=A0ABX9V096_9PSED|nr:hypothetical protein EA798_00380 [Pseudomonas songnenensis]